MDHFRLILDQILFKLPGNRQIIHPAILFRALQRHVKIICLLPLGFIKIPHRLEIIHDLIHIRTPPYQLLTGYKK